MYAMELNIGEEYSSLQELSWEESNFVTLYTRSSRSVEASKKRAPKRKFNDELKFSKLDYACVHGGRDYKSKSTNKREKQK